MQCLRDAFAANTDVFIDDNRLQNLLFETQQISPAPVHVDPKVQVQDELLVDIDTVGECFSLKKRFRWNIDSPGSMVEADSGREDGLGFLSTTFPGENAGNCGGRLSGIMMTHNAILGRIAS